ncbi:hypothetical protein LXA43DRAFT_1053194 [Ganoderma leucocontextum]|nr:hypothetical protein LXA43DRAFT_1053194 [Ganoderma leucocontextum]
MTPSPASRALQDAPYGWITDIPANVTIHKDRAVRMYPLKSEDLDDVPFDDHFIEYAGHYCNLYKERDVEWKAWEIHGGPIEYWRFLRRQLRAGKPFLCTLLPYSYRRGARYDLNLATPPALQDRYVCDSISLRDAKPFFAPWIWNACNAALDSVFLAGQIPLSAKDLTADREDAMRRAVSFVRSRRQLYTGRPEQPLESSPSITSLRQVLGQAPILPAPGSREWGTPVQGLEFICTKTPNYYDWDTKYLERVFIAACEVLADLGPGAGGWATARWEVYEKSSRLPGFGLQYDPKAKEWSDNAAGWLEGWLSSRARQGHIRSKCSVGVAFNELLPDTLPVSPVRASSQAGPSQPPNRPATRASA